MRSRTAGLGVRIAAAVAAVTAGEADVDVEGLLRALSAVDPVP